MTDSINNEKPEENNKVNLEEQSDNEEKAFVPKKAYQEVSSDMHRYKGKAKELEAKLNEYQAQLDQIEQAKLEEQGRWEEIARKKDEQLSQVLSEREAESKKFIEHHKKQSVIAKLGGFKKDEYASFINVSAIEVNDHGQPTLESLEAEVERIRANHPELLKANVASNLLPNQAPSTTSVNKEYSQMTPAEKAEYRKKLLSLK